MITEKRWYLSSLLCLIIWLGHKLYLRRNRPPRPPEYPENSLRLVPEAFLGGFILLGLSDIVFRQFGFFAGPGLRTSVLYGGGLMVFAAYLWRKGPWTQDVLSSFFSIPVLIFLQLMIGAAFLQYADGRFPANDDHLSFIYRLHLLAKYFPQVPFYSTDWNTGYVARDFLPSGALNIYFAGLPFMPWFKDLTVYQNITAYTYLLAFLFIILAPWAAYFAAKLCGADGPSSVLAAILSFGPSSGFFEWLLQYGTLGFCFSSVIFSLTLALSYRLAIKDEAPRWFHVGALLGSATMCIFWSLSVAALFPAALLALLSIKHTFARQRRRQVMVFVILFALLNAPWIYVFCHESEVFNFLTSGSSISGAKVKSWERVSPDDTAPAASLEQAKIASKINTTKSNPALSDAPKWSFASLIKKLRESLLKFNPLLLLFFLPGLTMLPDPKLRRVIAATVLWLFLLAAIGEQFKPQLELKRMAIIAAFLLCIPAAVALTTLLRSFEKLWRSPRLLCLCPMRPWFAYSKFIAGVLGSVIIWGSLFLSPLSISATYLNRSWQHFTLSSPLLKTLSQAIKEHGGSGRTFIMGFILHELGSSSFAAQDGGHVSLLTSLSGKPMYGMDYYHRYWTASDPIPPSYLRRGKQGIEEFLDLINATATITFTSNWTNYCRANKNYEEVFKDGRWHMFIRKTENPSYFMQGQGKLEYTDREIKVYPESEEVVIKFRYIPTLRVNEPTLATLHPVPVYQQPISREAVFQVSYIGMKVKPEVIERKIPITIKYSVLALGAGG